MHSFPLLFVLFLSFQFFLSPQTLACSQNQTLSEKLTINFFPANDAAVALTPASIRFAETPIVVRYTLMGGIAIYDSLAPCHATALSFFGTKDAIPRQFCNPDSLAIIVSIATYRALVTEFPKEMGVYAKFLRSQKLEITQSTDTSTICGFANMIGNRIAKFFASDNWNSLGDLSTRAGKRSFDDYTGYSPINNPYATSSELSHPLRWVPYSIPLDSNGRFAHQVHVTPQLGQSVSTLILSPNDVQDRRVKGPFRSPNMASQISTADQVTARRLIGDVIRASARLTAKQRFFANWWDNKLFSTAAISSLYERSGMLSRFEVAHQFMGEMLSQHDALIIAWSEKRRHDLIRPRSLVHRLRSGRKFRAWVRGEGVKRISADHWLPLLDEQPHSEFPSGSAALCTAAFEHTAAYITKRRGAVKGVKARIPANTYPFQKSATSISFDGPGDVARSCVESRMWAGVHFRPALTAGTKIGSGIGNKVHDFITELEEGRVPKACGHCMHRR